MSFESIDWDDDDEPPVERPVWTRWAWWRRLLDRTWCRLVSSSR